MVAYNGVLDALVAVAPKIRRNPAESGGFRRIVDHTYYVLHVGSLKYACYKPEVIVYESSLSTVTLTWIRTGRCFHNAPAPCVIKLQVKRQQHDSCCDGVPLAGACGEGFVRFSGVARSHSTR